MPKYELYEGSKHVETVEAPSAIRAVGRYGSRSRRNRQSLVRAIGNGEDRTIDPMVALKTWMYRDCEIEGGTPIGGCTQPDTYTWGHIDYDGPGDRRCGFAKTLESCKADIDEILLELQYEEEE